MIYRILSLRSSWPWGLCCRKSPEASPFGGVWRIHHPRCTPGPCKCSVGHGRSRTCSRWMDAAISPKSYGKHEKHQHHSATVVKAMEGRVSQRISKTLPDIYIYIYVYKYKYMIYPKYPIYELQVQNYFTLCTSECTPPSDPPNSKNFKIPSVAHLNLSGILLNVLWYQISAKGLLLAHDVVYLLHLDDCSLAMHTSSIYWVL